MTNTPKLPRGPVMLGVEGLELTAADRERLTHPLTGGVILFARNFASREQVTALNAAIHAVREPALVIAVDQEGGRVQRFREGFTAIPPMRTLGAMWDDGAFGLSHLSSFDKVAVVTGVGWIRGAVTMFGPLMSGRVRLFGAGDLDGARSWISGRAD